jgi:hypothetical protein
MSTKTLRKRIALVAVSALGAGLLSVVAVPSANAAAVVAGDVSITSGTGTATANIGICYVEAASAAATQKATVTTAATVTLTVGTSSTGYFKITSGPATFTGVTTLTVNSSASEATFTASTGSATLKASAVGTVKVTAFTAANAAVETYTITVVSSCAADTYSAADSYFRAVASASVTAGLVTTNVDDSGSTDIATAGTAYIALALNDAYGEDLSTEGALVATATNGALVKIGADSAGISSTSVDATTGADTYVRVDTPTAGTPITTVVTVTFNGTTIGSRSITLRGWGKSIKILQSDVTVGKSGQAYTTSSTDGAGSFLYQWFDAAGNVVPGGAVSATAATGLTGLVTAAVGGAGASVGATRTRSAVSPTTTTGATSYGDGKYTCTGATSSGSATLAVAGYNANLDLVVSNTFKATCGQALDTWTVSLDKATYAPGEIGTLTISGKDEDGGIVNDIAVLTGLVATIGGGATFVTAPTATDFFDEGVAKYSFLVGNTEGSYAASVTLTGATDDSAKTATYKVASTSGAVSNADVLKAIVSLIASINKQIAALQKALLRR